MVEVRDRFRTRVGVVCAVDQKFHNTSSVPFESDSRDLGDKFPSNQYAQRKDAAGTHY